MEKRQILIQKWENSKHNSMLLDSISDDIFKVFVSMGDSVFVAEMVVSMIKDIKQVFDTFSTTLTFEPLTNLFKSIKIFMFDNNSMVIEIDIFEGRFPLVVGKKFGNIYALKRLISNISGKYSYYKNYKNTIVLIDPVRTITK